MQVGELVSGEESVFCCRWHPGAVRKERLRNNLLLPSWDEPCWKSWNAGLERCGRSLVVSEGGSGAAQLSCAAVDLKETMVTQIEIYGRHHLIDGGRCWSATIYITILNGEKCHLVVNTTCRIPSMNIVFSLHLFLCSVGTTKVSSWIVFLSFWDFPDFFIYLFFLWIGASFSMEPLVSMLKKESEITWIHQSCSINSNRKTAHWSSTHCVADKLVRQSEREREVMAPPPIGTHWKCVITVRGKVKQRKKNTLLVWTCRWDGIVAAAYLPIPFGPNGGAHKAFVYQSLRRTMHRPRSSFFHCITNTVCLCRRLRFMPGWTLKESHATLCDLKAAPIW